MRRLAPAIEPRAHKPAAASQTEQITSMLLDILWKTGYINPVTAASAENKARRLVRRLHLNARDAPVILGMLRQVLWKITETGE